MKAVLSTIENHMADIPGGSVEVRDFVDPVKWISENYQMSIPGKTKGLVEVVKTIDVAPFLLSKYAVTESIYGAIMYSQESIGLISATVGLPAVNVSWLDAITFCNRLSLLVDLTPCYTHHEESSKTICNFSANGFRLPTVAEWQHACRSGQKGYQYGAIDDIAWYKNNAGGMRHENGKKRPNAWGLYDMLGNVWEWCWDLYDIDRYDNYRLFCGGSFAEEERGCGATSKRRSQPEFRIDDLGFRLCRTSMADI